PACYTLSLHDALPICFTPGRMSRLRPWLEEGFRRAGGGKSIRDLEIQPGVAVLLTDDVRAGLATLKPRVALYVGGMGHRSKNFQDRKSTRLNSSHDQI